SIFIDQVVNSTFIFFPEYGYMDDIFTYKSLGLHLGHHHFPFFSEHDNIIYIATITNVFVLPKGSPHETFFPVYIEFGISYNYFSSLYIVKYTDLCLSLPSLAIRLFKPGKIIYGVLYEICKMMFYLFYFPLQRFDLFLGLINIKLGDTFDPYFRQPYDIFFGNGTFQVFYMRLQSFIDSS